MSKNFQISEKELVLLKQKDKNMFDYLYDRYAPLIYGIILRHVKSDKLASEILKSTFINIMKNCEKSAFEKHSFFSWLLSLTQKTASEGFNVNIDIKSSLLMQKLKPINNTQDNIKFGIYQ